MRTPAACMIISVVLVAVILAPAPGLVPTSQPVHIIVPNAAAAKQQLSEFLTFQTVCAPDAATHVSDEGQQAFKGAHEFLKRTFPTIWTQLDVSTVSEYSLLILWRGSDVSLKPVALLSHLDVVPADTNPDTSKWTHPPFSGVIDGGYIYGRGALDLKNNVIAILHAVEQLLQEGFRPKRSLYVALGHDEEVGGGHGAAKIVERLHSEGVQLEMVLDEGGVVISDGLAPLTRMPIALVGTAEKDYSMVAVRATSPGGHASMPPTDRSSVAAMLARIIHAIDASPPPIRVQAPTTSFLQALASTASLRSVRWLLQHADNRAIGKLLGQLLARSPETSALVRTTAAVTLLSGGTAQNVLPQSGNITINFRHLPGHTPEQILEYVSDRVAAKDRSRVQIQRIDKRQTSSRISPCDGPHFQIIARAIRDTMGKPEEKILVAPYLVVGGTDSKHYGLLTDKVFRFEPIAISRQNKELARVHGTDERIEETALISQIQFFLHFIKLSSEPIE